MSPLRRIAVVGNSLPRRCGIATFTTDLRQAISTSPANLETAIMAMTDRGQAYDYPSSVALQINDDNIEEYVRAADFLNNGRFDIVCLQHEFGIFGGEAGAHIRALLSRLNMPVVTTLHTVLADPTAVQRTVMVRIVAASSKVVVMAKKARELLRSVYQVPIDKIEVVAHGIPDAPFVSPDAAKAKLGFGGKSVILTFGLLSPNKGIEVVIDAMPSILKRSPDAVYVVLGATHPNLVRDQGETYRESLMARARGLGVADQVVFLDRFVDQATLGQFISMCDDTGLFQHAVHSVPDRSHGYCVDDNARALLLACALNNPGEARLSEVLTARFAAFVQHAWNPDTRRFRNFMGFNRTWLEDTGSEDSHGRTLWALGETARRDASSSRRRWAEALFAEALSTTEAFRSPRAWAFTLLG